MRPFDYDAVKPEELVDDHHDVPIPPPRPIDRRARAAAPALDEITSQAELKREFYERLARRRSAGR